MESVWHDPSPGSTPDEALPIGGPAVWRNVREEYYDRRTVGLANASTRSRPFPPEEAIVAATRSIDTAALLQFWRQEVLGLSLRAAADRLGLAPATVWQWEQGETKPRLDPFTIDRLLGARGALGGLLWAVDTPAGLAADTQWSRVFRRGADATWIWVRPLDPERPPQIATEWGITSARFSLPADPDGAIYWIPLSMPEQPLFVRLTTPGWVDFGQGQPPQRVLDLPVVDSRESVERVGYPSQALGDLARRAAAVAKGRRLAGDDIRRQLPERLADTLLKVEHGDQRPSWVERVTPSSLDPHQPPDDIDRAAYRRLRLARNLSYRELALRLANELDTPVSADTLRRFETRPDQHPRLADLDAAIDLALDADGRLAVRPVANSATSDRLEFPPTWMAPVWIALTGVRRPAVVRLVWGHWTKEIEVEADTVVSMHCVQPHKPLRIESSDDIAWTAGIGYRHGSRPIDRNWLPADLRAATEVRVLALDRAATAFGLSRRWIRQLFAP